MQKHLGDTRLPNCLKCSLRVHDLERIQNLYIITCIQCGLRARCVDNVNTDH